MLYLDLGLRFVFFWYFNNFYVDWVCLIFFFSKRRKIRDGKELEKRNCIEREIGEYRKRIKRGREGIKNKKYLKVGEERSLGIYCF